MFSMILTARVFETCDDPIAGLSLNYLKKAICGCLNELIECGEPSNLSARRISTSGASGPHSATPNRNRNRKCH
jgi:hypothetical protein